MNLKKPLFVFSFFTLISLFFNNEQLFSQVAQRREKIEETYAHWFTAIDKFQLNAGITKDEYSLFSHFSEKRLDSLRRSFMRDVASGKATPANVQNYEGTLVSSIKTIYKEFKQAEKDYPSSVEEFRTPPKPFLAQICNSGCDNINFATGDLTGWYAYYAANVSNLYTNVVDITGGLAGSVKHAANDTLTSYEPGDPYYDEFPNPRPDYQVNITSGNRGDGLVPSIPVVSPFGGRYSVMLGDSTLHNYGIAMLSQTFKVSAANANFTYQYAVFLENPTNPLHTYFQQPFFKIAVLDENQDTIRFCGEYFVVAQGGIPGFKGVFYPPSGDSVYYKDWTIVNVPLTHYIGQCVTVIFEVGDCALGGHFGYAYVDASCSPLEIESSSPNFCGQKTITLTGPPGEAHYIWSGPAKGIISSDTLRQITVDSVGKYSLVIIPFTGATCADTLTISIGKKVGTLPHPDFSADTACIGSPTIFLNTSKPIANSSFYWDFYNSGIYNDSTVNPTWTYNSTGIYTVKLHELTNGCGMDTTINVKVDSIVSSSFIADTVCYQDTTQFANTTSGGITYYWNFGDPSSGPTNTSTQATPNHSFSAPGIYTVSLISKHPGWCSDTVKGSVLVMPLPTASITGPDSICYGGSVVLTAHGGTHFKWNTGAVTSSITVNPVQNSSYTVTVSNGKCEADTTYELFVKPVATGGINGKTSVCLNDTVYLTASGGGTYLWNTGATTSSIKVPATSFGDTAYSVIINNGKSCLTVHERVNIDSIMGYACCNDNIFAGDTIVISGGEGAHFTWEPPTGLSCDTCPYPIADPTVTTTYTLLTITKYGCFATSQITIDVVLPCKDFFVPNVFTPNGDGINDTYLIKTEFLAKYEISIYNRWGKEVFSSQDPNAPWNGTIDKSPASAGVYYYIIRSTCANGKTIDKHGFLQLIR